MQNTFVIEEVTSFTPVVADAVRDLVTKLSSNTQPLEDDDLENIIASKTSSLFIVKETPTQKIAGMVTLIVYRIPDTTKGSIEDLVVSESFRGNGLGEKLLMAAIEKAKVLGVRTLMLTSNPSRVAANKLYQKLGFEHYETNVYKVKL